MHSQSNTRVSLVSIGERILGVCFCRVMELMGKLSQHVIEIWQMYRRQKVG